MIIDVTHVMMFTYVGGGGKKRHEKENCRAYFLCVCVAMGKKEYLNFFSQIFKKHSIANVNPE